MSDGKTILVDVSRCTGCRGCQVACKQWNELPATDTVQTGSYQNPPDMNGDTYKIVRFREGRHENGKPYWNFFTDMCRHCVNPPCVLAADEGTMIHDEATGAVVYTEKTAENDFDVLLDACPYRIPRKNEKTGAIVKCTMCIDRISAGGIPACVQSCPTGAMRFGERAAMLELAHNRVEELKKEFPKAHAVAYLMAAIRLMWFKVYHPAIFYAVYFTVRGADIDYEAAVGGVRVAKQHLRDNEKIPKDERTAKDDDALVSLQLENEMLQRGCEFLPIELGRSYASKYVVEDGKVRLPFTAIRGLGDAAAVALEQATMHGQEYISVEELQQASGVAQSVFDKLRAVGALGSLPETSQVDLFSMI